MQVVAIDAKTVHHNAAITPSGLYSQNWFDYGDFILAIENSEESQSRHPTLKPRHQRRLPQEKQPPVSQGGRTDEGVGSHSMNVTEVTVQR